GRDHELLPLLVARWVVVGKGAAVREEQVVPYRRRAGDVRSKLSRAVVVGRVAGAAVAAGRDPFRPGVRCGPGGQEGRAGGVRVVGVLVGQVGIPMVEVAVPEGELGL